MTMFAELPDLQYNRILVVNALNGTFPLVLREVFPNAHITCAEVFPFFKDHLKSLGFEVVDWNRDWGDMKFDLVIGNPPYQNTNKSSDKLWPRFATDGMDLVCDNGHLMMVTPNGWFHKPQAQKFKTLSELFCKYQLIKIDLDANKFFPGIGDSIGWWMAQKRPVTDDTVVVKQGHSYSVKWTGEAIALTAEEQQQQEIVNLVLMRTPKVELYHDYGHDVNTTDLLSAGIISATENAENTNSIYWSASQRFFGNKSNIHQGWKVLVNTSGYYWTAKDPSKYVTYSATTGVGQLAFGIKCNSETECQNIISFLHSKLFIWVMLVTKTNGWNHMVRKLPMLDPSVKWDDDKIYTLFGLSASQRNWVDAYFQEHIPTLEVTC